MKSTLQYVAAITFLLLLWWSLPLQAQWMEDGTVICGEAFDQISPSIVSDGAGGSIMTWQDQRNGSDFNIYAQRTDAAGHVLWTTDGITICAMSGDQTNPRLCPDGAGGVVITWEDNRGADMDIYVQRIDSSGNVLWSVDGNAVCTEVDNQDGPMIIWDGSGGAIITWVDHRSTSPDIYVQRIDANGDLSWTPADGVPICTLSTEQVGGHLTTDGAGGAIITWRDARVSVRHPYAQRINASGVIQWTPNGIKVCNALGGQYSNQIISDDSGGAIITWQDRRSFDVGAYDIYAQRIDGLGNALWTTDGEALVTGAGNQDHPQITSDGSGGAIISWWDDANSSDYDLYVRRITAAGTPMWTPGGVPICTETGDQHYQQIIVDGAGGVIITWQDWRGGLDSDIYAQWIDASGVPQWTTNGIAICTEANNQEKPQLVQDGSEEAVFFTWQDNRSGSDFDIYAWRRPLYGAIISTIEDVPNDQGRQVSIAWTKSCYDSPGSAIPITEYTVYREIDPGLLTSNDELVLAYPPGDWHFIMAVPADCEELYSVVAPTLADSTVSGGMYYTTFFIRARTGTPGEYYDSNPDRGYSVDNIAPGVPTSFNASYLAGGVTLDWDDAPEADFQFHRIYRGADLGFTPSLDNLIHETAASAWTDPTADPWDYYYKIATLDYSGNESEAASPESVSGVQGHAVPARTTLLGAVPNPFNPSTKLSFNMAAAGHAQLKVYDPAGRLVATLVNEHREAGLHEVIWDGLDHTGRMSSAGVYLYRLEVGDFIETKRMTLVK